VDTVADVIASSRARMLAVTESSAPVVAHRALGLGACGVVARGADIRTLIESLIRARAGELVLPSHMLGDIVSRLTIDGSPGSLSARISLLTVREREILIALADGDPALQIAQRLGISPQTVQSHVKNVLSKLGVHSKLEAVGLAWRAGLGSADLPTQAS
jgi:DNA-binding NarL/FixJ family response regulator